MVITHVHILLLQNATSPDFFNTDTHWKRDSEVSSALGLLYGILPTKKNSRCIIMPHYHLIGNPNAKYYHTPGFLNCFNHQRCKYKSPQPFFKNNHLSTGLTVGIYPKDTIEIKLLNGNMLKTSDYFKEIIKYFIKKFELNKGKYDKMFTRANADVEKVSKRFSICGGSVLVGRISGTATASTTSWITS